MSPFLIAFLRFRGPRGPRQRVSLLCLQTFGAIDHLLSIFTSWAEVPDDGVVSHDGSAATAEDEGRIDYGIPEAKLFSAGMNGRYAVVLHDTFVGRSLPFPFFASGLVLLAFAFPAFLADGLVEIGLDACGGFGTAHDFPLEAMHLSEMFFHPSYIGLDRGDVIPDVRICCRLTPKEPCPFPALRRAEDVPDTFFTEPGPTHGTSTIRASACVLTHV